MSNPLKEEVLRFKKLFINYSRVIIGGMLLSGMFLFLYAGIRANYVSIIVLTTLVSTISLSMLLLLLYVRFHERRSVSVELTERHDTAVNEELKILIVDAMAGFSSTPLKTVPKPTLLVAEHVLLSVFQWGHLVGKMFYYGFTTVKPGKGPTEADH